MNVFLLVAQFGFFGLTGAKKGEWISNTSTEHVCVTFMDDQWIENIVFSLQLTISFNLNLILYVNREKNAAKWTLRVLSRLPEKVSVIQELDYGTSYLRLPPFLGSSSFACFSTDSWLITPNGKRRMDQINIGDQVLSNNLTATFYTPVIMWMHREPEERYNFYTIMTEYGKMLAVTAKHLVYRNECDEDYSDFVKYLPKNKNAVFAENLKIGDCLVLLYKGKYKQQRIMRISITERKGIFAPITENGRIIVNDIFSSCYSEAKQIQFQSKYFTRVTYIQNLFKLFGSVVYNKIAIPVGASLSFDILKLLLPLS